ncbi:MAG: TetR/AcrR family transcriptional regulator [Candidatus Hermodarchaeota archaeon]
MIEKKKKPHRNKDEKIKQIFQAFIELVNNYGYSKVSTRHIAKKAQVSVGTIYRYFPKGMPSIASGFYDFTIDNILNLNQLGEVEENNSIKLFEIIIKNQLNTHRENLELYKAFDLARMSNKELFGNQEKMVEELMEKSIIRLQKLDFFKNIPQEKILKKSMLFFSLLEAIIHRHLFVMPIFKTDNELIKFLTRLFTFIIQAQE